MDISSSKNEGILLGLGLVLLLTLSAFIPSSWLGAKPTAEYPLLSFDTGIPSEDDLNNDGVTSWREFIASSLGMPDATTSVETDPRSLAQLNDPNNLS